MGEKAQRSAGIWGTRAVIQQPERGALARQLLNLRTPEIRASECHTPKLRASESAEEHVTQYQAHPSFLPSVVPEDSPAAQDCMLSVV